MNVSTRETTGRRIMIQKAFFLITKIYLSKIMPHLAVKTKKNKRIVFL